MSKYKQVHAFDFHDGVKMKPGKIKEWHKAILKRLSEPDCTHTYCASGNSFVLGVKSSDGRIEIKEFTSGYINYVYESDI